MIRLHIEPRYKSLLERHQLLQYAQIMNSSAGEMIDRDKQRDIQKIQLGDHTCYLKRTWFEKGSSAVESYLSGRLAHSKPFKEMQQLTYLREHGFNTAEVIASGEELKFGIPAGGFILTREVWGEELSHKYRDTGTLERADILAQLGELLGQLHRKGFFLSVRLKDVFLQSSSSGPPTLVLIDREARNPAPKRFTPDRARESLFTSLRRQVRAGDQIAANELKKILQSYCDELADIWAIKPLELIGDLRKIERKQSR